MRIRIIDPDNEAILDHSQLNNMQPQVQAWAVASHSNNGHIGFRIMNTGGCQLWIGEYNISSDFVLHGTENDQQLKVLISCPQMPGDDECLRFDKNLKAYPVLLHLNTDESFLFDVRSGKGSLLLFSFLNDYSRNAGLPALSQVNTSSFQPVINRAMATVVYDILYNEFSDTWSRFYLRLKCQEIYLHLTMMTVKAAPLQVPPAIIDRMAEVTKLIRYNPDHSFRIAELSAKIGIGSWQLQRYFKLCYGIPLHHYILHFKMNAARKMITGTDKPLKQIALEIGYRSDANFSEAFKKYFGYAPGQLRKNKERTPIKTQTKT